MGCAAYRSTIHHSPASSLAEPLASLVLAQHRFGDLDEHAGTGGEPLGDAELLLLVRVRHSVEHDAHHAGAAALGGPVEGVTLFVAPPAVRSVSGIVYFEGIATAAPAQTVTFVFRPTDGSATIMKTASVPAAGAFSLSGLPAKSYTVHVSGSKWLAANVSADMTNGDKSGLMVNLPAGDANGDNTIDPTDFGIFVGAYNTSASVPGSGYDARADFNCDGFVDPTDFGLFVGNYNTVGAN